MAAVKEFLKSRGVGYYMYAASALCALVMFVVYVARGGDVLTGLEPAAVALGIIGVLGNVGLLIRNVRPLEILPFILYTVVLAVFVSSEINFIANVINGVDGNSLDGGFFCVIVFGALAVVLGMAACIVRLEKTEK